MNAFVLAGPAATTGVGGTLELVTLAEFQAYIVVTAEATLDAQQQILLNAAHQTAYTAMGGRFILRPATEFDYVLSAPDDGSTVFFPQYPIGTISVIQRGYMSALGVWTSQGDVAVGDYYQDSATGRIYGNFPTSMHNMRVKCPAGYVSANVPADIKEAVMMHTAVKFQRVSRSRWDVKSEQTASQGASYYESDIPPAAAAIYQTYRLAAASIA